MLAVVCSRADSASVHICEHLRDIGDWTTHEDDWRPDADGGGTVYRTDGIELREFDDLHLQIEDAADAFGTVAGDDEGGPGVDGDSGTDETDPDLLVFASRHSGETGPLLTAHFTGNFGAADHGGDPATLARACPHAHSRVLDALAEYAPGDYEVGMECTHHGPTSVGVPSMFVEVGSAEPQWDDPDAARAAARAILDLRGVDPDGPPECDEGERHTRRHLVGFGGGHYAPRFGRIARETDWAVGHVAADWSLDTLREYATAESGGEERTGDDSTTGEEDAIIAEMFAESGAEFAVVDGDYPDLVERVESLGHRVVGETFVRETAGVGLGLVDRLEAAIAPVADGLRFGDPARDATPDAEFAVDELPTDLLAELEGGDAGAVRDTVEAHALAFTTDESGNRLGERGAFPSAGDYDELVADLVALLRAEYDTVERSEDVVIARKRSFDPEKASTLGVPEGPKFGELAAGNAVEVDGETITPEQVESDRERRFPL